MCAPRVETAKDGCGRGNLTPTTRHYRYGPGMLSGARATEGIRSHGRRYPRPLTAAALLDSLKIRPEASPVSREHQAQNSSSREMAMDQATCHRAGPSWIQTTGRHGCQGQGWRKEEAGSRSHVVEICSPSASQGGGRGWVGASPRLVFPLPLCYHIQALSSRDGGTCTRGNAPRDTNTDVSPVFQVTLNLGILTMKINHYSKYMPREDLILPTLS